MTQPVARYELYRSGGSCQAILGVSLLSCPAPAAYLCVELNPSPKQKLLCSLHSNLWCGERKLDWKTAIRFAKVS